MKSKKTYLVTGGAGFLGSALVKRLVAEGQTVRVLDNEFRGNISRLKDVEGKVEFIKGDIRDLETVKKAVQGVDSVCHLASINGTAYFYSMPDAVLEIGVKGILNILDACIAGKVRDLLVMSSSEVYQLPPHVPTDETAPLSIPDPLNPRYSYAGNKLITELLALNYSKHFDRVLVVRPHNAYGPEMGWEHVIPQFVLRMNELRQKNPSGTVKFPIQGSGQETRSFVYVDDFTDGMICVLENGKHREIYHLGTQDELSVRELAEQVAQVMEVKIEIQKGELTQGSTPRRCPDIRKARTLGYSPRVSLQEGIRKTANWYVKNAGLASKSK